MITNKEIEIAKHIKTTTVTLKHIIQTYTCRFTGNKCMGYT